MKFADSLIMLLPNLIYLTCLAHKIHRICDKCIWNKYYNVDKLIATVKNVFLKAPSWVKFNNIIYLTTWNISGLPFWLNQL